VLIAQGSIKKIYNASRMLHAPSASTQYAINSDPHSVLDDTDDDSFDIQRRVRHPHRTPLFRSSSKFNELAAEPVRLRSGICIAYTYG
jgi:hypothetical protein